MYLLPCAPTSLTTRLSVRSDHRRDTCVLIALQADTLVITVLLLTRLEAAPTIPAIRHYPNYNRYDERRTSFLAPCLPLPFLPPLLHIPSLPLTLRNFSLNIAIHCFHPRHLQQCTPAAVHLVPDHLYTLHSSRLPKGLTKVLRTQLSSLAGVFSFAPILNSQI